MSTPQQTPRTSPEGRTPYGCVQMGFCSLSCCTHLIVRGRADLVLAQLCIFLAEQRDCQVSQHTSPLWCAIMKDERISRGHRDTPIAYSSPSDLIMMTHKIVQLPSGLLCSARCTMRTQALHRPSALADALDSGARTQLHPCLGSGPTPGALISPSMRNHRPPQGSARRVP